MSKVPNLEEILELPVSERIALVQMIWDSIAAYPDSIPMTDEQRRTVAERFEAYLADPEAGRPWEEIRDRLLNGL